MNFLSASPSANRGSLQPNHVAAPTYRGATDNSSDSHLNEICKEYPYVTLKTATEGFSKSRTLGHGSFGAVYRGNLPDQTIVAVKAILDPSKSGFEDEVKVLSKYRHPNLIMLLGFARNGPERLLVYDLLELGDCEKMLRNPRPGISFTWRRRLSVLLDACRGLTYLVTSSPIVFHRDIKSSNILVDKNWVAKIADFGLACELPKPGMTSIQVRTSAGTMGYACPHYIQTGIISESSEIYSFGTCILDFLTNKPAAVTHPHFPGQVIYLVDSLLGNMNNIYPILDESAGWPTAVATDLSKMAMECCSKNVNGRTSFVAVASRLSMLFNYQVVDSIELNRENIMPMNASNSFINPPLLSPKSIRKKLASDPPSEQSSVLSPNQKARGASLVFRPLLDPSVQSVIVPLEFDTNNEYLFGRNRQSQVLNQLISSDSLRLCVSREHFKIERLARGGFMLVNLSGNGTIVQKFGFLGEKNDTAYLVDGDVIRLVQTTAAGIQAPFLEMQFSTTIRQPGLQIRAGHEARNEHTVRKAPYSLSVL